MKAQAMKLVLHDICCHEYPVSLWRLIIGWHFTANMSIYYYCHHLDYGHLTYSSVQWFPFIDLFVAPITISKLTATNIFPEGLYLVIYTEHGTFQHWNAARVFLHECICENNQASSEKLRCRFNWVFPVMPAKAAFERFTLITAVAWNHYISGSTAPPAGRETLLWFISQIYMWWPSLWTSVLITRPKFEHLLPELWISVVLL